MVEQKSEKERPFSLYLSASILFVILLMFASLFVGRYPLTVGEVVHYLRSGIGGHFSEVEAIKHTVIWQVRLPRAILAVLVGGALAVSGGALQGMFRNPLVDSGMLGVSAGAGFGAALSIILFNNQLMTYLFAFLFGMLAVLLSYLTSKIYKSAPTVTLVLGGVVISSIFSSMLSFLKYIADPYEELPTIVFWLMGSLSKANYQDIKWALVPIGIGTIGMLALRWRINVLSLGDREAKSLGVNTPLTRMLVVGSASLATAGAVCVSGTIGWVGLVIPHIGRMIVGNDNRKLLPMSFAIGAAFLLIVDNVGRTITPSEIPIGVLTALIGGPFYIWLLKRSKGGHW